MRDQNLGVRRMLARDKRWKVTPSKPVLSVWNADWSSRSSTLGFRG
jgi:hypothetical protein